MNNILTVTRKEYLERVTSKYFIITTILGPLFFIAVTLIPAFLATSETPSQKTFGVIDKTQPVLNKLKNKIDDTFEDGRRKYVFKEYDTLPDSDKIKSVMNKNNLNGFILIEEDKISLYASNINNFTLNRKLQDGINSILVKKRLTNSGLDPQKIRELTEEINLSTFKVTSKGTEEESQGEAFMSSYIMMLVLYMVLIFYGVIVMRSVIEEKSNRIVEIIISSMKPRELLAGKLFGIGLLGFTQLLIWCIFAALTFLYSAPALSMFGTSADFELPDIKLITLVYFLIYFVLGFFLFATLYLIIGSMVDNEKEAQQLQMPVVFLLIIPMILLMFITKEPNSVISVILSLIPFFTPLIMLMRIGVTEVPLYQIILSMLIMSGTIVFVIWLAARIYRVGILMYGKKASFPELVKWFKQSG